MTTIIARIRKSDGQVVEVLPDGAEREFPKTEDWSAFDALTDEEVIAAALTDPDNPPMTDEQLKRMRPVAKSKRIRWKLGISREAFAEKFHIPLDLVTTWEHYQAEPDAMAAAYLDVIAADPEAALAALTAKTTPKAAE